MRYTRLFLIFVTLLFCKSNASAQQDYDKYYTNMSSTEFLSDSSLSMTINPEKIDVNRLNATLFHLTNEVRTKYYKTELRYYNELLQSAELHSVQMVKYDFFSHINKREKKWKTPSDRIYFFEKNYVALGENIVENNLLEYQTPILEYRVELVDGEKIYLDTQGVEIPYSSYYSLAQRLMTQWMNSPPHKENILSNDFSLLGCACAIDGAKEPIRIKCTQNFGSLE